MQKVECYLPLKFVTTLEGEGDSETHVADVITEKEFVKGGGARLMGPLTRIPDVTIERIVPPPVQRQAARLNLDPYAIIFHATPEAELTVHRHLQLAGLVSTDNAIRILRKNLPNKVKSSK